MFPNRVRRRTSFSFFPAASVCSIFSPDLYATDASVLTHARVRWAGEGRLADRRNDAMDGRGRAPMACTREASSLHSLRRTTRHLTTLSARLPMSRPSAVRSPLCKLIHAPCSSLPPSALSPKEPHFSVNNDFSCRRHDKPLTKGKKGQGRVVQI